MTVKPGNVLPLQLIPTGTVVHNLALSPQGPARLVRSAGTFAQIVSHEDVGKYTRAPPERRGPQGPAGLRRDNWQDQQLAVEALGARQGWSQPLARPQADVCGMAMNA
jgi:hypothetical protein